ncbi:MAG: MBL fold metallo-hydrolase [Eubacteriales bacterium]|nr:MBL fold metallo-hydrolase [Eubacteriales bacterium]
MKLKFLGAARSVTGSLHLLELNGKNYLVDCGMEQGGDNVNNNKLPVEAVTVDAVLVTHAHIDHSGRLPLLVKRGFRGEIITTPKTAELLDIMLRDSAHIQEQEASWRARKHTRAGDAPVDALYTMEDVEATLPLIRTVEYDQTFTLDDGLELTFIDSGHLLGAASIRAVCTEGDVTKTIVFSGDIGNTNQPLIRDPQYFTEADIVLMETTYGNRFHKKAVDYVSYLAEIFDKTLARGGNVIIPSFAVGRTQQLLYFIRAIKDRGLVKSRPDFKVYVDSPLAKRATEIYDDRLAAYCDDETMALIRQGINPMLFHDLHLTESTEESIELNRSPEPKVILSASGMCEAGRIRHHLKHNLWRKESTILFVGYQAEGTLGRALVNGKKMVKLFGETIAVNASIENVRGLSAHADRAGLETWIRKFTEKPVRVFLVHGETEAMESFNAFLQEQGYATHMPEFHCVYDIRQDAVTDYGMPRERTVHVRERKAYERLVDVYVQLGDLVRRNREYTNKDISKLARALEDVREKFS